MSYLRPTKSSTLRKEEQKEKQEAVLAKKSTMRGSMKTPNTARAGKVQPGPRGTTSRLSESIIKDEEVKMVKMQPPQTVKKATTPRVGKPSLPSTTKKPLQSSNEKSSGTKSLTKKPEVPKQATAKSKLNTGLKTRRPSTKESPKQEEDDQAKNSGHTSSSKIASQLEQTPGSSDKKNPFLKKDPTKITLSEGLRTAAARRVKKQDSARDSIASLLKDGQEKRSIMRKSVGSNGSLFFGSQNKENMSDGSKEILFQPDSFKESLVVQDIFDKKAGKIANDVKKQPGILLDMDSELKFAPRSDGAESLMSGVSSHDDGLFQLASSTLNKDKEESIQALLMRNTVVESENNINEFTVGKIRQQEVKDESVYIEEFTVGNMRKKLVANSQRSQSLSSMTEDDIDSQEFQIARQFNDEQNVDNAQMLASLQKNQEEWQQKMQDQIQQRKRELDDQDQNTISFPAVDQDIVKSPYRKPSPDKDSINYQLDSLPNIQVMDDSNSLESGSQILVSHKILSPEKNTRGGAEISFDAQIHEQGSKSPARAPNKPPHIFRSINLSKSHKRMSTVSQSQRFLNVSPNPDTRKSLVSPRTGGSRSGLDSSDSFRTANALNKTSDPLEYQSCGALPGESSAAGRPQSKDDNFTANFDVESQARDYGLLKQNQEIILGSFAQSNASSAVKNARPAANLGFSFQVGQDGSPGSNPYSRSITKQRDIPEIATVSVTAIPISAQTQKQADLSPFADTKQDRIIIELPSDPDQKQGDDGFEQSLTQEQQEKISAFEDRITVFQVQETSFSQHTELERKSSSRPESSRRESLQLLSVCSSAQVQVVEEDQFEPKKQGPLPEDLRGSIVDNGELFAFLQNQYCDDNREAQPPSASIRIDKLSDHNKSTITDEDKMTLEEKIKLRKAKLQTDKKLCLDPGKTLKKLDISDLGDHREYTSPHFNKYQFKNTNNFRLDDEKDRSIDFKFREEDDLDIELRNHKMNLSSSTEKSKTWLKDIENGGFTPSRKESIEIQNLDDIKRESHRVQKNVKPSKEKAWKAKTNPEENINFIPKNEEESWDVSLSRTEDQSVNVSGLAFAQKMQSQGQKPILNDFNQPEATNLLTPPCPGKQRRDSDHFEPHNNRRAHLPDDTKSNYSRISKISKFTNNMMNKSNNGVNDQWYQFIYNDNLLNDSLSDMNDNKSDDNRSRFTLRSKISNTVKSNFSKMSKLQKQLDQRKSPHNSKRKSLFANKSPTEILIQLIDNFDICRFIRISWLISPMINSRYVKARLFNFRNHQVMKMVEDLRNPVTKAICLYLSDELHLCQIICQKSRQIYLKQKSASKKDKQFLSQDIAKIYIIELACLLDMINYEAEYDSPVKESQRKAFYRAKAHDVIEEIPILVKNKNQHQFTIIELLVQFKEKRAYSKLKDLDFISYRLFKLERAIWMESQAKSTNNKAGADMTRMYLEPDEYEEKTPEQYAHEIQEQFSRVAEQEQTIKMVEYFIFGALSAFRNHHFTEAWNFVSQAPFVCNFGEQIADIETLVVFEMLKMVELKLLTKIGRPEQAVIQLTSRYFRNKVIDDPQYQALFPYSANQQNSLPFQSALFMDQTWCLYKQMKYYSRLIEFRQDHFKFKMVSMQSQDYNWDAQMLQKANDDQCNQIYKLWFIVKALRFYESKYKSKNRLKLFEWMLIKTIMKLDKNNQTQQMISNENFNALYQRIDVISFIQELQFPSRGAQFMLPQLKKHSNRMLIQDYISKYMGRIAQKPKQQASAPEEIQKTRSTLDQRLSFNQKSGLFEKGQMESDFLTQNRIGMERQYTRMIQQSSPQFYIMLQHLIDFVQYKVIKICQFVFYETVPKNTYKQQYQTMGANQNSRDSINLDFTQRYGQQTNTSQQKSKTFQNYFDLLKTDSYHKQVRNIQQALNLFLASIELIVFQNLTQVQELVEYDLQKKEEYRAIETIYINEHYFKDKNGGNNQIYASGDEQYSNLNFTQMSQSGFGFLQNDHSQSYISAAQDWRISQDFEKLKQETSNNFGSHLSVKPAATDFPQNIGSSRLNETQMQQNKRRIDMHIKKNMHQNPNQTQNNGNQQRSSIVEVKNFRDLSEVNRRRNNNQVAKFEASDDNSSMVIYEGGDKSSDGKQKDTSRMPRFEKNLRIQNPQPFRSIVRDRSAASALGKRSAKRERSEFRIKKIEYFNKTPQGSPDFPQSRKLQAERKAPEIKVGSLGGRQEEGDFLIEMNQSIQQKSRRSRTLSSRRSSSQTGRAPDQNQYNFNFLTKQSPLGPDNCQDPLFVTSPVGSNHNALNLGRQTIHTNHLQLLIEPATAQPRASVPIHGFHQRTPTHTDLASPDPHGAFCRPLDQNSADEICNNIDALSKSQVDMSVPGLSALGIALEDTYHIGPSQMSDATPTQLDDDEDIDDEEDSSDFSDEENVSINNLIQSEEEKMNFEMIGHTIYSEGQLYDLCMACCLADTHQKLAIRIISVLIKIRSQQKALKIKCEPYMRYLDIMMAYVFLRLNYKQFQMQQNNLNTSRILPTRQSGMYQNITDFSRNETNSHLQNTTGVNTSSYMQAQQNSMIGQSNQNTTRNANLKQRILTNLQNQDYFLQQALKYFKQFEPSKYFKKNQKLDEQDTIENIMVMMFLHVQNELDQYKLLKRDQPDSQQIYSAKKCGKSSAFKIIVQSSNSKSKRQGKEKKKKDNLKSRSFLKGSFAQMPEPPLRKSFNANNFFTTSIHENSQIPNNMFVQQNDQLRKSVRIVKDEQLRHDASGSNNQQFLQQQRGTLTSRLSGQRRTANFGMNFGRRTPSGGGKNFDTDDEADFQECAAAKPSKFKLADQTREKH